MGKFKPKIKPTTKLDLRSKSREYIFKVSSTKGCRTMFSINPFVPNVPFFYPRFSDVFRGQRKDGLGTNGLNMKLFSTLIHCFWYWLWAFKLLGDDGVFIAIEQSVYYCLCVFIFSKNVFVRVHYMLNLVDHKMSHLY